MKSSKARKIALQLYGHHYTRLGSKWDVCFYCGDVAESLDHVPPINIVAEYGYKTFRDRGVPLLLVPCCAECNSALGSRSLNTVADRIDYLLNYYARKIDKRRSWSADEIGELGRGLKPQVVARQARLTLWIAKLRNLEARYLACVELD